MADDEDEIYRRRISDLLINYEFDWVLAQAEAQIAEGKPSSKQVSEQETFSVLADPMFTIKRPRSRRASLITSEPYNEAERLDILLQAIEAAIVQRAMIEEELLDRLNDATSIRYEPDGPVEAGTETLFGEAHTLDAGRRMNATQLKSEANSALQGMRRRDHADT
jgi:hypothetical protein